MPSSCRRSRKRPVRSGPPPRNGRAGSSWPPPGALERRPPCRPPAGNGEGGAAMADDRRDRGSGSLRLRGGIYQARYFHNGHKVEESTKTSDLGKAKRFLRNRLRTAGTPSFVGPQAERVTFADLKAGILHDYTVRKQNRSTKRLKQALVHLEGTFGLDRALAIP